MNDTDRRTFLKGAGAAAIAPAVAGCLGDDDDTPDNGGDTEIDREFLDEEPDYGGWLDDVGNYDGTVDMTGEDEVRVMNGVGPAGQQFGPPAIAVDPGTTVVWEWTGNGGTHNVQADDGSFESELSGEEGFEFEHTFEEEGIHRYFCSPHQAVGQKGAVVVR